MIGRFLDWLTGLPTVVSYSVLAVLSAVENIFPPVPADVAVVLGAFLAQRGGNSPWLLGFICWLANVASAAWMYDIARRRGPAFFATGWPAALMPPAAQDAIREAYARYGVWGIFFTRFLPAVRSAVTPFAGVAGMPARRVLPPAAAASAIWYAFLVAAGTAVGNNWERAERMITSANRVLGLVALGFTVLFAAWLWKRVRARRVAVDEHSD